MQRGNYRSDQGNRNRPCQKILKKKRQLDGGNRVGVWEIFLSVRQIRVEWEYSKNLGGGGGRGGDGGR